MRPHFTSIIIFILLVSGNCNLAADWPRFLGPLGNGISRETNLISKWGTNGPALIWDKEVGTGYSAPSILGDLIVLHHRVGRDEQVEAFSKKTGSSVWKHAYPSNFIDPYGYNNGPRCTPLLVSNRCYTFGAEGKLLCLDLQNGKLIWERDTAKEWEIPEAFFGVGSTPILDSGVLIVMVGGQPNSGVVGLEPETGRTLWESVGEKNWQGIPMTGWRGERTVDWQRWEKQASYSSPVAATVNGQRQIFCLMRQGLVSVNPTNGHVNFSFWFRATVNESVNAANPVVVGNSIFISGAYYKVGSVLLEVQPGNNALKEKWRGTNLEVHWTTPIYHKGHLYAFSGRNEPDAMFRCVKFDTGEVAWSRNEQWQGHTRQSTTYGRGSAILADGKLFVLGEAGLLGLFKASPGEPIELARAQIPQLRYPCWTAPVLSDGKLYLRSESRLLCLNVSDSSQPQ
ncbi:MAG: PQQ-binding-like beta-propeller repeat protein [Verrucomicrobiota bacterium]|nr:PQQ-binding-like beta-propeller repeat protein [Verrucomicrobiota bacterium]